MYIYRFTRSAWVYTPAVTVCMDRTCGKSLIIYCYAMLCYAML